MQSRISNLHYTVCITFNIANSTDCDSAGITYSAAGVDIEAGDKAVELMKTSVKSTLNKNVLELSGGFAGMFDISEFKNFTNPVLCTSTDGVGTKIEIARVLDKHDTIGYDLVGMVIDDIAVCGAKPLFMTDYICTGKVVPSRIAQIVGGVANACKEVDTALVGGETAEHPGLLADDEYDIAGAATGIIEKSRILGPDRVEIGDKIIAFASSGLHSNGFSLVRKVIEIGGFDYTAKSADLSGSQTIGEILLTPTRLYSNLCLSLAEKHNIHTYSHITGGGLAANIARVLPENTFALINRSTWELPNVFEFVKNAGNVPLADLEQTLNCGIGMVAVVNADEASDVVEFAKQSGVDAWECGEVLDLSQASEFENVVSGTKGVIGGSCALFGEYK